MDALEAILRRRSIRRYQDRPVEEEKIGRILLAAVHAPSAGDVRCWRFIVVRNRDKKEAIYRAALRQPQVLQAPVLVVVAADLEAIRRAYGRRGVNLYSIQDAAAATENMLIAATSLGLGTCWIGAFSEGEVSKIVGLPPQVRPLAIVTIGYPAETPTKKVVRPEDHCFSEVYGRRYEFSQRASSRTHQHS